MPRGSKGEKRPGDVIRAAMVGRIGTGEIDDAKTAPRSAAAELGSKGGKARARALSKKKRAAIAKKAATARWKGTE